MKLDLTGQRYGKLTVIKPGESINGHTRWLCVCDCGKEAIVTTSHLRNGSTKSCGCFQDYARRNRPSQYHPKDVRNRRLYQIWYSMCRRCNDKTHKGYHRYGGRGISVCSDWNQYESFARWALSHEYDESLTIDRIDNDGNYEPNNCRWVTIKKQLSNTCRNRFETINGETKTVTEWAEEYGVNANTVLTRMSKGISILDALTMKPYTRCTSYRKIGADIEK